LALEDDTIDLSAVESLDPTDVTFSEEEVELICRSVLILPAPVRATLKQLNDKFAATRRQAEVITGADYTERTLKKMKAEKMKRLRSRGSGRRRKRRRD